jgi:hypothetical protein
MTTMKGSNEADDVKNKDSLTEPLLPLVHAVTEGGKHDKNENTNKTNHWSKVQTKIITSFVGCGMAVLSHSLLSMVLWKDSILRAEMVDIVLFSFAWSFWTCVILFAGMLVFVSSTTTGSSSNNNNNKDPNDDADNDDNEEEEEDDWAFQIEAQYVVAALLTISAIWLLDSIVWSFVVVLSLLCLVLAAGRCYGGDDQTVLASYSLVAGTLGLIFGACSQFLLSLGMWRDVGMTQPIIDHIVWFSLAWSLLTVLMTFCGCLSLRWIVAGGGKSDDNDNDDHYYDNYRRRHAILRMEAVYVAMTLVGICAAWIFLDVTAGLPEQIVPSLLMLTVSLAVFTLILQCFPEEDCLLLERDVVTVVASLSTESSDKIVLLTPTKKTVNVEDDKEEGKILVV